MKTRNLIILSTLMGVCLTACNNEPPYAERDARLLAWLEEEKTDLWGDYAEGDSIAFTTETGDTAWMVVTKKKANAVRMEEKGWITPPKETYIDIATCSLQLDGADETVILYAEGRFECQSDADGNSIPDGHGDYLYKDSPTIHRYAEVYRYPTPDITEATTTVPPTAQSDESLYIKQSEKDGTTLVEWALVRKGQGILRMADAYGHTWTAQQ